MQEIENLVKMFARLPGFGPRSARRAALYVLKRRESFLLPFADALWQSGKNVKDCRICGNIDTRTPCHVCMDERRDKERVCVVEDVGDLWALSRIANYKGQFHVLRGVLSPIDGMGPEDLRIPQLLKRVEEGIFVEVILATNLTVEGQSTAHYIADKLAKKSIKITRIAHGVPVGGELDYMDDSTLTAALNVRRPFCT